jgi:hypothetical protein
MQTSLLVLYVAYLTTFVLGSPVGRNLMSIDDNGIISGNHVHHKDQKKGTNYLYAWVGSDAGDHLAVIDYSPDSDSYGSVINRTPLPSDIPHISTSGNEPHHIGITGDQQWIVTSGLTSFLKGPGKHEIFVWSIDEATKKPSFAYSLDIPGFACPDEFVALNKKKTEFAVTMMCNAVGNSPGAIFRLDVPSGALSLWQSPSLTLTDFNPHGFDVNKQGLVSADYINPSSLFLLPENFQFRDTLRHFNQYGTLNGVFNMPTAGAGYMDFHFFPDPRSNHLGIACSTNGNYLYKLNTLDHSAVPLLDLAVAVSNGDRSISAGIYQFSNTGNRLLMTFQLRFIVLIAFDAARTAASVLQVFDFCSDLPIRGRQTIDFGAVCENKGSKPGPHYLRLAADESTLFLTNYFIVLGNADLAGSKSGHSFTINKDKRGDIESFSYDFGFAPDFQGGSPHGLAQGVWKKGERDGR